MSAQISTGRRSDLLTLTVRGAAILLLAWSALWASYSTKPVHTQATEYTWLAAHGTRENDTVVELGWQEPDGHAKTVIVEDQQGRQSFVYLESSDQKVTEEGVTIPVVLDQREAPGVGIGAAPDILDRSFTNDYVNVLAKPVGLAVFPLLGAAGWEIHSRRRRYPASR